MDLSIIVGFSYMNANHLSSCLRDIYSAYSYRRSGKCIIITDWNFRTKNIHYNDSQDWIEFISRKTHINWVHVNNLESLESAFSQYSETICQSKRIMFYYTGHGCDTVFELPDGSFVEQTYVRKLIHYHTGKNAQILYVLDCCSPSAIGLPYELKDKKFYRTIEDVYCDRDEICIASSKSSQESHASNKYSLFTKYLFRILPECCSLSELVSSLQGVLLVKTRQQVCIYSSHYRVPILWSWAYEIDIKISYLKGTLLVVKCSG